LTTWIIVIPVLIVLAIILSGFEFAFIKESNSNLIPENKSKSFGSTIIQRILEDQKLFVSTFLLGRIVIITIICFLILHISGFYSYEQLPDYKFGLIIIIASVILVSLVVFLIPLIVLSSLKTKSIDIIAIPLLIIYLAFYPLTKLLFSISGLISGLIDFNLKKENLSSKLYLNSRYESLAILKKKNDEITNDIEHDIKIFHNAIEFSKTRLRDCAIPRNEIEAIELDSSIEQLKERFIETGYSKILVFKDSIDNIIGYAQSNDMFRSPKSIDSILKNLVIVPETMPANKLMNLFLKEHKSLALVVDEFGGTYGLATLEDIMEEIFGEFEDEHDSTNFKEEKISENEFIFSGRLEIDYINEKYGLNIPESDEYATVAGFILYYNEELPQENDKISIENFDFEILNMQNPKIELVKLIKMK